MVEQREAVGHAVRAAYMYVGDGGRRGPRRRSALPRGRASASGRTWCRASSTSPAAWARATRARPSGTTSSCRTAPPTARPAPRSPSVYWNQRLFLQSGDAKYVDVLERTLYNAAIAGVSLEGRHVLLPEPARVRRPLRVQPGSPHPQALVRLLLLPDEPRALHPVDPGLRLRRARRTRSTSTSSSRARPRRTWAARRSRSRRRRAYPWDGRVALRLDSGPAASLRGAGAHPGLGARAGRCRATSTATLDAARAALRASGERQRSCRRASSDGYAVLSPHLGAGRRGHARSAHARPARGRRRARRRRPRARWRSSAGRSSTAPRESTTAARSLDLVVPDEARLERRGAGPTSWAASPCCAGTVRDARRASSAS